MSWSNFSTKRVRIRPLSPVGRRLCGDAYQKVGTNPTTYSRPGDVGAGDAKSKEITRDEIHPVFMLAKSDPGMLKALLVNPLFPYLQTGGAFESTKTRFIETGRFVDANVKGFIASGYRGWVSPIAPSVLTTFPDPISDMNLMNIGAKCIKDFMPGQPIADLAETMAEIQREGMPSLNVIRRLQQDNPKDLKNLGEVFLNLEFGWKPIIKSIFDAADAVNRGDAVWSEYVKQGNTLVRRHYEFPIERTTTIDNLGVSGGAWPPLTALGIIGNSSSDVIRSREMTVTRRFSAAYKYYLPVGDQNTVVAARKVLQYKKQFGLDVDPQLLWDLTPWSWFVDWFLPVGNLLGAYSDLVLGNTVLPWAYISEHYQVQDSYTRPGAFVVGSSPGSVGTLRVVYDYKRRIRASPFGFGLSWDGFNPKQLAIMAAIGITR